MITTQLKQLLTSRRAAQDRGAASRKPTLKVRFKIRSFSVYLAGVVVLGLGLSLASADGPNAQKDHLEVLSFHWVVGMIPNQTLRVTVCDPNQTPPANERGDPVRARVRLLLADGSLIREIPALTIPPGGFSFVDLHRAELALSGESPTGRVQVRAEVFLFIRGSRDTGALPVSGEIINDSTGQTLVYGGFGGGVRVAGADVD
jgi:hypothetical protein